MPRDGIFAQVPDDLKVGIKIAAIQNRITVRELVTKILGDWLTEQTAGVRGRGEGSW